MKQSTKHEVPETPKEKAYREAAEKQSREDFWEEIRFWGKLILDNFFFLIAMLICIGCAGGAFIYFFF